MIWSIVSYMLVIVFGLAGGLAVGSGMVAFLLVLDVIPRLAQLARKFYPTRIYETAVVYGAVYWTLADFFNWRVHVPVTAIIILGTVSGIFIGMLAGALTEVLNVLPILAKRLGMSRYMMWLLFAMVLGKVCGSLFDWLMYYH
ncbi:MAG: stage V sporulation protein AB [Paenibacillus sp. RIFOXYA1_FULL_44_5]|nr:MAG: stage V sporulation protein AB [Paenibacillus sp. RIFOXYA1_FULL_44_5]